MSKRSPARTVSQGCGIAALVVLVAGCVLVFALVAELSQRGYPEAEERAERAMAESHAESIECLRARQGEIAGLTEQTRVAAKIATCFDRPEGFRQSYPLTALVGLPEVVVDGLDNSLQYGSYLLDVGLSGSAASVHAMDVGTGSSETVFMATTATETTARCWLADLDLDTGSLGTRQRVECGDRILTMVYGDATDRDGLLLGD